MDDEAFKKAKQSVDESLLAVSKGGVVSKESEGAALTLSSLYAKKGDFGSIRGLLTGLRPWFKVIPKVRTSKIVRQLVRDLDTASGVVSDVQVSAVQEAMEWAEQEGMGQLRQSLATELASLLYRAGKHAAALEALAVLLREIKRLDDKQLQVEAQLLESRVHHALHNTPKARAALTAARTAANAIYCPPLVQAQIDMQAGILHAEEKDYKTAYSYFYECFEGYSLQEDPTAVKALKYMLLCKIMTGSSDDISHILTNKAALKYSGREIDSMRAIAGAYKERSLREFSVVQNDFKVEIVDDPVVHDHLTELYNNLLEQNLLRIIEPYSCVEIAHVAHLIDLPVKQVERKLSQMILDKRFEGVLDAANGCLHVWEEAPQEVSFKATLDTIGQMNKVVTSLFENCAALN